MPVHLYTCAKPNFRLQMPVGLRTRFQLWWWHSDAPLTNSCQCSELLFSPLLCCAFLPCSWLPPKWCVSSGTLVCANNFVVSQSHCVSDFHSVWFVLRRPPAWHGCSTYRSQQINQTKRSTAALMNLFWVMLKNKTFEITFRNIIK